MIEALKNGLVGKLHMPHTQMMEYGMMAVTIESFYQK